MDSKDDQPRPVIAFDETGNTGQNLLDGHQPLFALASVSIEWKRAEQVLGTAGFDRYHEAHYSRLKKTLSGRARILRVLEATTESATGHITVFHKRYMSMTKIVDMLIEEYVHSLGGPDLYERGGHVSLSNLMFYCTPTFCGVAAFENFLASFVHMIRHRSKFSVVSFYCSVDELIKQCSDPDYRAFPLGLLRATEAVAGTVLAQGDKTDLDPAWPAFVQHVAVWSARLGSPFDVVHDDSHVISHAVGRLEMFKGYGPTIDYGNDGTAAVFPLTVADVHFVDSKQDPRVQVADLLAGAARDYVQGLATRDQDGYLIDLGTHIVQFMGGGIWPDPDVFPAEAFDAPDPDYVSKLDQLAEFFRHQRN